MVQYTLILIHGVFLELVVYHMLVHGLIKPHSNINALLGLYDKPHIAQYNSKALKTQADSMHANWGNLMPS